KFLSRSASCIHVQRHEKSLIDDDDDEDRVDTINLVMKFLLKLLKDVFIFPNNEISRHCLQLQASMEVLQLFTAAKHQNAHVRRRFLQRILNKVAQWKLSVLFLGFTTAVSNDNEDLITENNLKSVIERLYLLPSKGSGRNHQINKCYMNTFWNSFLLNQD
ncbi:unnamed protein product, partial [Rotaria sp. Silwood2]